LGVQYTSVLYAESSAWNYENTGLAQVCTTDKSAVGYWFHRFVVDRWDRFDLCDLWPKRSFDGIDMYIRGFISHFADRSIIVADG
jgi:hypothetical protein